MTEQASRPSASLDTLEALARARFGEQRTAALHASLQRLAAALDAVAAYPLPPETEPDAGAPGQHVAGEGL